MPEQGGPDQRRNEDAEGRTIEMKLNSSDTIIHQQVALAVRAKEEL